MVKGIRWINNLHEEDKDDLDDNVESGKIKCFRTKEGGLKEVDRAIIAYLFVVFVCIFIFYYILSIRFKSSFIISIIISQVFLNVICMPTRINFWTELNSSIATYSFVQLATPLVVFIYAIGCGLTDKKNYCFVKRYCNDEISFSP